MHTRNIPCRSRFAPAIAGALLAGLSCAGAQAQRGTTRRTRWRGCRPRSSSEAKAGVTLRSSYFQRSKANDVAPPAEAWGVGGWIWGETGELANISRLGGAYYFVGDAYGPPDGGGNFILDNEQSGYSVLGEAWGRIRFGDHSFTIGRQALAFNWSLDGIYRTYNRYDGAFIGRRDVRAMVPLNFESATLAGKFAGGNVRYYGGYAWNMRQINSTSFDDLAEAALLPGDSDGMIFAGAQWKITNDLMLQGAYHGVDNLLDIGWVDLDYVWRLGGDKYLRFDTQYIYQGSNGQAFLGDFSTWNWAGYVEARWVPWFIPYGAIGFNGDGEELRAPYSLGPSYLVQRVGENAKAGEQTCIIGTTFDFTPWARAGCPSTPTTASGPIATWQASLPAAVRLEGTGPRPDLLVPQGDGLARGFAHAAALGAGEGVGRPVQQRRHRARQRKVQGHSLRLPDSVDLLSFPRWRSPRSTDTAFATSCTGDAGVRWSASSTG